MSRGSNPFEAPAPTPTGAYIMVFDKDIKPSVASRKVKNATGLKMANSKDFDSEPELITTAFKETNAIYFSELGLGVVKQDDPNETIANLTAMRESGDVLECLPEFYLFGIDELQSEYRKWVQDGVRLLAKLPADLLIQAEVDPESRRTTEVLRKTEGTAAIPTMTWGLETIDVPNTVYTGKNIRLAVLDTGIDLTHPDFEGREITSKSFIENEDVQDLAGHGTHCAGTAAGPEDPDIVLRYGVAHQADLFVGKVLSNGGSGTDGSIIAGIEWAIHNKCAVISMSLGRPTSPGEPPMLRYERIGEAALDRDCLIIAAAGNESARRYGFVAPVGSPANASTIMAVGAIDSDLRIADFSCGGLNPSGGEVNLCAPGVDILSSVPMPRRHARFQGTSMACPHVAGVAALWAESDKSLRGRALWTKLENTTKDIGLGRQDGGTGLVQAP